MGGWVGVGRGGGRGGGAEGTDTCEQEGKRGGGWDGGLGGRSGVGWGVLKAQTCRQEGKRGRGWGGCVGGVGGGGVLGLLCNYYQLTNAQVLALIINCGWNVFD